MKLDGRKSTAAVIEDMSNSKQDPTQLAGRDRERLETSPAGMLRMLGGVIVAARAAHPGVLHLEVRDESGGIWRLASQDADWAPSEPGALVGQSVQEAKLDTGRGQLRLELSGGETVEIEESREESSGEVPAWELIAPSGLALAFGPGLRWTISEAQAP